MTDIKDVEKRVNELEIRLKRVEDKILKPLDTNEEKLMNALYDKAKELVLKNNRSSVIFLQKKLIIDMARAKKILEKLQKNGVIKTNQT
ncbi:hypothetical protein A2V49_01495 [candidate division WWE3 bacterium RBG_19FT_COMBO_34_6]|uniref:FtsK gamma domain-containing protein n=1 Tax=candidate division WWE3 bacterium RBG_19FT_COMBO_34_6 TaxID=1802612 RepID=A0A1F4UK16_UNCKA|nr:MAG: hypothetical protein A2V49_01495 [candidate division WWE3 bacterium RBG_19FT_COMBO_34_6]